MQNLGHAFSEKTSSYYRINEKPLPYTKGRVYSLPNTRIKKSKKKNKALVFFAILVWSIALLFSASINYKTFLGPVYLNRINNRSLHFSPDMVLSPTLNYANNLNFMGMNLLSGIPLKKEKIIKINSTGELTGLKNEIQGILGNYQKLHAGIYIFDYMSGKTVEINQDEVFPAASIIKIPVLIDLFNRSGDLEKEGFDGVDLQKKLTFTEAHRTEGSGNLQYKSANTDYSIDYLAKIMIRNSDNSATNLLIEEVGGINELNNYLRHWGFSKTQITSFLPDLRGTNTTTPKEISTLLYNIDNPKFLDSKSSSKIKDYMSKVENRTLIKSQIPDNATIIHKTGDIGSMLGDSAIIYAPSGRKFILTIMVKRPHNDYGARELIQKVSKTVYNALS